MKVELEYRIFLPLTMYDQLVEQSNRLFNIKGRYFVKTLIFDNPNPNFSFYDPKIDGRLRLRLFQSLDESSKNKSYAVISWEQRCKSQRLKGGMQEYELEIPLKPEDFDKTKLLFIKILRAPLKEYYEMYRNFYMKGQWEITVSKYPFCSVVEIEWLGKTAPTQKDEANLQAILSTLEINHIPPLQMSIDDVYEYLYIKNKGNPPNRDYY